MNRKHILLRHILLSGLYCLFVAEKKNFVAFLLLCQRSKFRVMYGIVHISMAGNTETKLAGLFV